MSVTLNASSKVNICSYKYPYLLLNICAKVSAQYFFFCHLASNATINSQIAQYFTIPFSPTGIYFNFGQAENSRKLIHKSTSGKFNARFSQICYKASLWSKIEHNNFLLNLVYKCTLYIFFWFVLLTIKLRVPHIHFFCSCHTGIILAGIALQFAMHLLYI